MTSIYCELADRYKEMDAASEVRRRNILAQHLKEVVDILEQKVVWIHRERYLLTNASFRVTKLRRYMIYCHSRISSSQSRRFLTKPGHGLGIRCGPRDHKDICTGHFVVYTRYTLLFELKASHSTKQTRE